MSGRIPAKGCDRPALKYLNKYVRKYVSTEWFDLGIELLEQEDEEALYEIKANHPNNANECCKEMFQLWLRKSPSATWDQLIQALRDVDLNTAAAKLEEMLTPMEDTALQANEGSQPQLQLVSHQAIVQSTDRGSDQSVMKYIHGSEDNYEINFEEFENVSSAFSSLFSIFLKVISYLNYRDFQIVKTACIIQADKPLRNLLESASDSPCFFQILAANNMYCNWIRVDFLEIIAHACVNKHVNKLLVNLIKNYKKVIFSKPLHKVWSSLPHYSVRDKYYDKLKATFDDKDPDNVTIDELFKRLPDLAKEIQMIFAVVQKGSLIVHWLIQTDKVYEAYLSFLNVPQQSRMDMLLEFGNWIAYPPHSVLVEEQKKFGAVSNSVILIGYYHGLLIRDLDADLLVEDMYLADLVNVQEQNLILSGYSLHLRNWLLLEHVRHLNSQSLLAFSGLVQDIWPQVGLQLATALSDEIISVDKPVEPSEVYNVQFSYIKTASVLTSFFQVVDLIGGLLQFCDIQILVNHSKHLMASNKHNINLFSDDQIQVFNECSTALLLLQMLRSSFIWSNHSTLRALVDHCSEAVSILDDFDVRLDPLEPIVYYPVPCFSTNMTPSDTSAYTILAVRCKVELYESSLQDVYDVQSVMIEKCDITQHCLQLLAVRSDPTILYWTIPKCVVDLINTNVPLHSEYLYSRGILEVLVYPDLLLTTGDDVCYGSLVYRDQMFSEKIAGLTISKQKEPYDTENKLRYVHSVCDNLRNQLNHKTKLVNDSEKAFKKQTDKVNDLEEALKKQTDKVNDLEEALRNKVDDEIRQQSTTEGSDRSIENLQKVTEIFTSESTDHVETVGHQHHKPKLRQLCHYSEAVSSCWKQLALELDLPYDTINRIDKDHNCIEDKCYDMFNTWLQRSPDACWCHIVKALVMQNMLRLANDIEKSFLSEKDSVSPDKPVIVLYPKKEAVEDKRFNPEIFLYPRKKIGQGRHGTVYAAMYYGSDCVAKRMHDFQREEVKNKSRAAFLKEIQVIQQLKHPNIIEILEICQTKDDPHSNILVMQKMPMTLNIYLKKNPGESFLRNKVTVLHNIICGLHYLHSKGIMHLDLTVNAIFLTEDLHAKIADFGQAKLYDKSKKFSTVAPWEHSHMPPEAFDENARHTFKLDIFSFGCVVIHVITNEIAIPCHEIKKKLPNDAYVKITEFERRQKHINKLIELHLHELCKIIKNCLQDNPDDRPMASDLLPFIQKYKEALPITQESVLYKKSKFDEVSEVKHQQQKMFTVLARVDDYNIDLEQERETTAEGATPQLEATRTIPLQQRILLCVPEMGDLLGIVVPRISSYWEDVAYALYYDIAIIQSIKSKHNNDPKRCCRELFKDWLLTNNGAGPKTWSTLLNKIKYVEELEAATEVIMKQLFELHL